MTIQIRGDFEWYTEYASIHINNVDTGTTCNPNWHYGSYFTCGSFSVPSGSLTIQVYAGNNYVSGMQVKIDFGNNFHGSKVHVIQIFTPKILGSVLCFKESVLYLISEVR